MAAMLQDKPIWHTIIRKVHRVLVCDLHQFREKPPHDMVWQENWHHNSIFSFTVPKTSVEANKRYIPASQPYVGPPPPTIHFIEPHMSCLPCKAVPFSPIPERPFRTIRSVKELTFSAPIWSFAFFTKSNA